MERKGDTYAGGFDAVGHKDDKRNVFRFTLLLHFDVEVLEK